MQPIILAAGKGTRMRSDKPKVLYEIGGKPMLQWILDTLSRVPGSKAPLIVVGHNADMIRAYFGPKYRYVKQIGKQGTAAAVSAAMPYLAADDTSVLILYGDHPLIKTESIEKLQRTFKKENAILAIASVVVPDFEGWRAVFFHYGRILRGKDGSVGGIIEYKDASKEERALKEVNSGLYCVNVLWLRNALPKIKPSAASGEYYLTDIVSLATLDHRNIVAMPITPEEGMGINSREEAAHAQALLAKQS